MKRKFEMTRRYDAKLMLILTGGIGLATVGPAVAAGTGTQGEASSVQAASPGSVPVPTSTDLWKRIEHLRKTNSVMAQSHPFQLGSRTVDWYTIDYANKPVNDAIEAAGMIAKVTRYPSGSLMVKVNYTKEHKLTGITAMLKIDGYDAADRNWLMAAYTPAGKVHAYGKVAACISCHEMVRTADFNFAPPPDQLLPVTVWKAFFPKQTISTAYAELLKKYPDSIVK